MRHFEWAASAAAGGRPDADCAGSRCRTLSLLAPPQGNRAMRRFEMPPVLSCREMTTNPVPGVREATGWQ